MKVQEGDTIAVRYTGKLDSGDVFDANLDAPAPLVFDVGAETVIEGFDKAVLGLALGESTTVRIPPEEAYGGWNEGLVARLDPKLFEGGDVQVGTEVDLEDESGNQHPARVIEIAPEAITVDLNHPLAGQALTFEIKVENIERPE